MRQLNKKHEAFDYVWTSLKLELEEEAACVDDKENKQVVKFE